jgi:hypothetical protein
MAEWYPGRSGRFGSVAYFALLIGVAIVVVWQAMAAGRRSATPATALSTAATRELECQTVSHAKLMGLLPEASGLALSRRTPDVLWSLNDSDAPVVIALNSEGEALGRVRVTGANVSNWEDVSVAPCANGSCLYIADTGNGGGTQRNDVVIYRVPEPKPDDKATVPAEVFNAAYPADEDHEAEAVFVVDGQLFLVTKGHPSLLFRFPRNMPPGSLATLERIGQVPTERFLKDSIPRRTRITDAETSPDGNWVALRTNDALLLYRTRDLIAGNMNNLWYADLRPLDETQGEGVAMSEAGDVYLASEGGGHGLPGTFARIRCELPK